MLSLEELRTECGNRSLCMILGMDAFLGLTGWHRWQEIPELAHLVVVHRPGWRPPGDGLLGHLVAERSVDDPSALANTPAGHILIQEVTRLEIASSAIREALRQGRELPCGLLVTASKKVFGH